MAASEATAVWPCRQCWQPSRGPDRRARASAERSHGRLGEAGRRAVGWAVVDVGGWGPSGRVAGVAVLRGSATLLPVTAHSAPDRGWRDDGCSRPPARVDFVPGALSCFGYDPPLGGPQSRIPECCTTCSSACSNGASDRGDSGMLQLEYTPRTTRRGLELINAISRRGLVEDPRSLAILPLMWAALSMYRPDQTSRDILLYIHIVQKGR